MYDLYAVTQLTDIVVHVIVIHVNICLLCRFTTTDFGGLLRYLP